MIKFIQDLISVNGFSRPGRPIVDVKAVIIHNIGMAGQTAKQVRDYWAGLASQDAMDAKPDVSASAHFIVDLDGSVLVAVPETEKAYHIGSSLPDPESGKIYTDLARQIFGEYAEDPDTNSPNRVALGIEMCQLDDQGTISDVVLNSAAELCADLCKAYDLDPLTRILTHHMVVGWKPCPLWMTNHPEDLTVFRFRVSDLMHHITDDEVADAKNQ